MVLYGFRKFLTTFKKPIKTFQKANPLKTLPCKAPLKTFKKPFNNVWPFKNRLNTL